MTLFNCTDVSRLCRGGGVLYERVSVRVTDTLQYKAEWVRGNGLFDPDLRTFTKFQRNLG